MANDPDPSSPAYTVIPVTWDSGLESEPINLAHFKLFLFHCKADPSGLAGDALTFKTAPSTAGPFQLATDGLGNALTLVVAEGEDVPVKDSELSLALASMNLVKIVSDETEDGTVLRIGANR